MNRKIKREVKRLNTLIELGITDYFRTGDITSLCLAGKASTVKGEIFKFEDLWKYKPILNT